MARIFKGLRREPENSYDAVVVGAGIGGLICANLLQRAGLAVLLVEQHYMVGGYCSTFRRKGYTFDAATHFYPLLGNTRTITGRLLNQLGVRTEWAKMDPVDHFHFPDGSDFKVPADFPSYIAKVKQLFPEEAPALDAFFREANQAYAFGLLKYFRNCESWRLKRYLNLTLRDVLERHFRDPKLKLLLCADCSHWGSMPSRTSFVFDSMLRLAYFLGNYYPRGGSQAFADELAFQFEQMGGHILMSARVNRILTSNGVVSGIDLDLGTSRSTRHSARIACGVAVSNADVLQTVEQLLAPGAVDPDYAGSIRKLRPSLPCFITHIGVKGLSLSELQEMDGYHWQSWDPEDVATQQFKIFIPTLYEEKMAPPGGHILIVQKLTDIDFHAVQDWEAHKAAVESYVLRELERVKPGFAEHIVVCTSASAWTSYRYTLNYCGSMLGWEMSPDQLAKARPGVESPVKNLYLVGHWTQPGGGITPVIVSAMQVAQAIQRGTGSDDTQPWLNSGGIIQATESTDFIAGVA